MWTSAVIIWSLLNILSWVDVILVRKQQALSEWRKKQVWWTRNIFVYEEQLFFIGNAHLSQRVQPEPFCKYWAEQVSLIVWFVVDLLLLMFFLPWSVWQCSGLWRAEQMQVCVAAAAGPEQDCWVGSWVSSSQPRWPRWDELHLQWGSWENTLFLVLLAVVPLFEIHHPTKCQKIS